MQPYNDFAVGQEVIGDARAAGGRKDPYTSPYFKGVIVRCNPDACDIRVTGVQSFTQEQLNADAFHRPEIGDIMRIHKIYIHRNVGAYDFTTHRSALRLSYELATGKNGRLDEGPAGLIANFAGIRRGGRIKRKRTRSKRRKTRKLLKKRPV
jgi:hypothetical protein